jgi:hypothetical protein
MATDRQLRSALEETQAKRGTPADKLQAAKEAAIRRIPLNHHRFIVYAVDHVIRDGGSPTEDELKARSIILAVAGCPGTAVTDSERDWLDSWWQARLDSALAIVQQASPGDPLNWESRAERLACGQS